MVSERSHLELDPIPTSRGWAAVAAAFAAATIYLVLLLSRIRPSWLEPLHHAMNRPRLWIYHLINGAAQLLTDGKLPAQLRLAVYLLVACGLVPWLILALLRRGRPHDLGFRIPNRYGWRFALVSYLLSLPFLLWMVRGTAFGEPYLKELAGAGTWAFSLYYFINMLTEHFLLHGAFLAAFRIGHRWPGPPVAQSDATTSTGRILQWIGLAQNTQGATGLDRLTRWFGLQGGCLPAIAASAMLFGLIHVGKNPRELVLSLPGGLALAYIAYRTNSWYVPFVIHLATAGTAWSMIVLASG